jgi:hypothetical protein
LRGMTAFGTAEAVPSCPTFLYQSTAHLDIVPEYAFC